MKKVLKNILKWLALVIISFSVVFTAILSMEGMGIIEAIGYKIDTIDEPVIYKMEISELEESCKNWQEMSDSSFNFNNEDKVEENIDSTFQARDLKIKELYEKYPAGVIMLFENISMAEAMSDLYIISLVMGIVVGTAIYFMLDKDKKGLKVIIAIYIIFVLILGFVEGIGSIYGENLTLLDKWVFPETYIIPVTAVFALAVVIRIIRQKDIAKKLNEKLEKGKQEKDK